MSQARFVVTRSRARPAPPPAPPKLSAVPAPADRVGSCGGGGRARPDLEQGPVLVNGREIEPEDIAREMQNHPSDDPAETWQAAARALVVRELLLTEARRRGVAPSPEELGEGLVEAEEESLIRQALEAALEPSEPSDEECQRVYEGMRDKFVTPTLFEAAHILIEPPTDDAAGWAEAEAEARTIIAMVGDDAQLFAEAAARSACPTGMQGGSLGQIRRGELAEPVQKALEALAERSTGDQPVRSRFGWHVVRLERRIPGRALPFEVVAPRIRDMLEARAWSIGAAQYVADLAARASIEGVEITPPDAGFSACEEGGGC